LIGNLVEYQADHACSILDEGSAASQLWSEQAKIIEKHAGGVTLLIDDRPVVCTGLIELWENCAEAWVIASSNISRTPVSISRAMKRGLNKRILEDGYDRVQANVRADWPTAIRFAEFVGMKREGMMRRFGPEGADYVRFAWVR
tara:strand:- start:311 stop:742 length:432 start_codon:yes stop_codon:yes gene_type:complete